MSVQSSQMVFQHHVVHGMLFVSCEPVLFGPKGLGTLNTEDQKCWSLDEQLVAINNVSLQKIYKRWFKDT